VSCSRLAGQEIFRLLHKPTVYYRVNKRLPVIPILSQMNPAHTLQPYFLKLHFNIVLPSTTRSSQYTLPLIFFQLSRCYIQLPLGFKRLKSLIIPTVVSILMLVRCKCDGSPSVRVGRQAAESVVRLKRLRRAGRSLSSSVALGCASQILQPLV
jgi:hypothetical protein